MCICAYVSCILFNIRTCVNVCTHLCMHVYVQVYVYMYVTRVYIIDIKKVDKKLTHAMQVKDRHVNDTFIDKFIKWH